MWSWGRQWMGLDGGGPNMNFTFLVLRAAPDGRTGHVDVDGDDDDGDDDEKTLIMQSVSTFVVALGPVFARQVG